MNFRKMFVFIFTFVGSLWLVFSLWATTVIISFIGQDYLWITDIIPLTVTFLILGYATILSWKENNSLQSLRFAITNFIQLMFVTLVFWLTQGKGLDWIISRIIWVAIILFSWKWSQVSKKK